MSLTRIPGSQVPVLESNGLMSREWYRFLYNLFQLTGGGGSDVTPAELQAEVDLLQTQVSGIATEVNTLESSVTVLDNSVDALQIGLGAVENESRVTALAPRVVLSELNYGSFYDTTTQTAAAINTAYAITFNTSDTSAYGVYRGSPTSRIYVTTPGVYNFQFSAQIDNTSGGNHLAYIWYRVNGVDATYSASQVRLKGTDGELIAAWNFYVTMGDTDYFELMWSVSDTAVQITAQAAAAPVPGIPSAILTVNQVSSPFGH